MLSLICFFKQKTAYEMRISDWSSDVCSSDEELEMAFPTAETLGQPDPRFLDLVRIIDGRARPMEFADQYEAMVTLELSANTPPEVRASFDRGRSIFLFAWYDYELLVPAELQALAAFEMAIQMKLGAIGPEMKGTMHNLIRRDESAESFLRSRRGPCRQIGRAHV